MILGSTSIVGEAELPAAENIAEICVYFPRIEGEFGGFMSLIFSSPQWGQTV